MSRWDILKKANRKYAEWESCGKRANDPAAIEALALYREFHGSATDPFTRAFCAAFNAATDTRGTTPAERDGLVDSSNYATAYITQTLFDFLDLAGRTMKAEVAA